MARYLSCTVFLFLIFSFQTGTCYPTGASTIACRSGYPSGHGVVPQTSNSPFTLETDKMAYDFGERISVTVSGTDDLRGILLQVKIPGTDISLGSWEDIPDFLQTLECEGSDTSITHRNNAVKTSPFTLTWIAPNQLVGSLQVVATIVKNRETFWTGIVSETINQSRDDTVFMKRDLINDTFFIISDLTETSMQLTWEHNPASGIQQYFLSLVHSVTGETQTITVNAGTTTQTFNETFTGLTPATEYVLQIDILVEGSNAAENFIGPKTVLIQPHPPELTLITQTAENAVRFEWLPPTTGDLDGYFLELSISDEPIFIPKDQFFYEVTNLLPYVDYQFGLYSYAGPADPLNVVLSDLGPTDFIPLAPIDGNVTIDSITSSSLNVLWDAIQGAESYLVTLVDANNQLVDGLTVDGQTTQLAFPGLDPSTVYEARVKVVIDGLSYYAGENLATTLPVGTPFGVVNVLSTTMDTITIEYTEIQGATSYQIIYVNKTGATRMLTSTGSPYTIPGLDPATEYNIEVNGLVGGQTQLVGNTSGTTDFPDANINPVFSNVGTNTFTITWEDISGFGFASYEITYTNEHGITMATTVPARPGFSPSRVVQGLSPGQRHDVVITGTRSGMVINLSSLVQFTKPLPPGDATFTQIYGTNNINVTWKAPSGGVTNYVIMYIVDGTVVREVVDSTTLSTIITNFVPGQTTTLAVSAASGTDPNNLEESVPVEPRQIGNTVIIVNPGNNPCVPNSCPYGGECVAITPTTYMCQCLRGFTALICQIPNDVDDCQPPPCFNGGQCFDIGNTFQCICAAGFDGNRCGIETNECGSGPCQNGGQCIDLVNRYQCNCAAGYTGTNCQTEMNECISNPCVTGLCIDEINRYSCQCPSGFDGTNCQTNVNECASNPCLNGGVCIDHNNGYQCLCPAGLFGGQCTINPNECGSNPCQNGGICMDQINAFVCDCAVGFSGTACETITNDCGNDPCVNGQCVNLPNGFLCNCDPGFEGTTCAINPLTTAENKSLEPHIVITVCIIVPVIASILVILVIVILWKRRRQRKRKTLKLSVDNGRNDNRSSYDRSILPLSHIHHSSSYENMSANQNTEASPTYEREILRQVSSTSIDDIQHVYFESLSFQY